MGVSAFANGFVAGPDLANVAGRVAALLESERTESDPLVTFEGRHLNANFQRVSIAVDGARVDLTRRELRLLRFLVTHRNHVLTRNDLLLDVWGGANDGRSRTIDVHIRRLRKKLGAAGEQIHTVPSVGYRFDED